MPGLVLELQKDALDKKVDVSDLLRKAMVVSKKLGISEIQSWIEQELSGYSSDESSIPGYREVTGSVRVYNPYHGWQPLHFGDAALGEELSKRKISQAIGELVVLATNKNSSDLQVPFTQHTKNYLMKRMGVPLEPTLIVSDASIIGILDAVRTEILNWALELESKGIIGDGMSFSTEEKKVASQVTYQITNNIGSMQNSQLQQDSAGAYQTQNIPHAETEISSFIRELKASMQNLELNSEKLLELEADVNSVENQLSSPNPKRVIIIESLKSVKNILEGATGSILATGLLTQFPNLL